ncbi:MAG: PAS domain-containing protein [Cyclobacteriaceae bacterium]
MDVGKLNIVILEDVESDAELVMLHLEHLEYSCEFKWCKSGTAYEKELSISLPDVVIADFSLPGYDGLKALGKLREMTETVPFIFVTGTLEEENAVDAIRAGATDFILKKYIEQLPAALMRALREKHLMESRVAEAAKFKALIQHSSEGLLILDTKCCVTFCSSPTLGLLRRTASELIHTSFLDLVHSSYKAACRKAFKRIIKKNSGSVEIECKLVIPNRQGRWFHLTITDRTQVQGVDGVVLNLTDIHPKKLAEHQIELSEKRFRALVEESDDLNAIIKYDGTVTYCSDSVRRLLQPTKDSIVSSSLLNFLHPDDRKRFELELQSLKSVTKISLEPFRLRDPGTGWKWISAIATNLYDAPWVKGIVLNGSDQTRLLEQAKELKLSNERYSYALKASKDLIYDWDLSTGKVERDPTILDQLFGYEYDPARTSSSFWTQIVHWKDKDQVYATLSSSLEDPDVQFCDLEYRILRADRRVAWVYDKGYIIRDEQGKAVRLVGAVRDISAEKIRETHLFLINKIKGELNRPGTVSECMKAALKVIGEFASLNLAEAWVVSLDGKSLNLMASWAEDTDTTEPIFSELADINSLPIGKGMPGNIYLDGTIQLWDNLSKNERFVRMDEAGVAGIKNALGIPVMYDKQVVAVIILFSKRKPRALNELVDTAEIFGQELGGDLQRKRIEFELNTFFELSPDLLCIVGFDGYFKKVSPSFTKVLGYTIEELLSKPYVEFIHPEDEGHAHKMADSAPKSLGAMRFENRYLSKEGKVVWLSWVSYPSPELGLFYSVGRDNTKEKETALELEASYKRLKEAHDIAQIGYWRKNLEKNTFNWNGGMFNIWEQDISSFTPTEAGLEELTHPDDRRKVKNFMKQIRSENPILKLTFRIKVGGRIKWVQDQVTVEDENNTGKYLKGVSQDISERMHQLERIKVQNKSLREIAWLQSHEVRAPLARMLSIVHLIQELDPSKEEIETWLRHLHTSVNELDEITKRITEKSYPLFGEDQQYQ